MTVYRGSKKGLGDTTRETSLQLGSGFYRLMNPWYTTYTVNGTKEIMYIHNWISWCMYFLKALHLKIEEEQNISRS